MQRVLICDPHLKQLAFYQKVSLNCEQIKDYPLKLLISSRLVVG